MPRMGSDNGKALVNLRFSCDKTLADAIREYAQRKGVTVSEVVRDALATCSMERRDTSTDAITVRIPESDMERLKVIASGGRMSKSAAAAEIIRRYLFE